MTRTARSDDAPAEDAPAEKAPARKAPAKRAPAAKAPARKAARTVVAGEAVAQRAPAKRAPAKRAPAKKAPAKRAPAKRAPVEGTPVQTAVAPAVAAPEAAAPEAAAPEAAAPEAAAPEAAAPEATAPEATAPDAAPSSARPEPAEAARTPFTAARGSVAARAALALALLVGYYVLAVAIVGGLGFLTVQAVTAGTSGVISTKLAVVTGLVALAVGRAVFAVERRNDDDLDGVPASRADQPELWALIDDVSRELGVPAPDDVRLVDDVNAFVHQDTKLLGLVGGARHMGIGVALLQVLTVDELRGVIAHELGHYAGGDTRLSSLVYRASTTIARTVAHLGPDSLIGKLFAAYARLYQRASLAVRRRQELRADEASARLVGPSVHESALREVQAAAAAWGFFADRYVVPVWQAGSAPQDLYVGYRALLDDPARQDQLDEVRYADEGPAHPYDSHPSLGERIANVRRLPERPVAGDERAARSLLRDPHQVEQRVTGTLNQRVLRQAPAAVFAFTEQLDAAPYTVGLTDEVAALSRATATVDGGAQPAGLDRTLALIEAGRDADLVTALTGDRRELGEDARWQDLRNVLGGPVATAAACALVDAGHAAWRASWSGPVQLVDRTGGEVDLAGQLDGALGHGGVTSLRPVLQAAGVPLHDRAVEVVAQAPDEQSDDIVMVWPELRGLTRWRRRTRFDALVTRDLLVLVPQGRSAVLTFRRWLAREHGIGREGVRSTSVRRVQELVRVPLDELCARDAVRCLRWDDLPQVGLRGGLTTAWVLLLPDQRKPLHRLKAQDESLVPSTADTAALLAQLVGDRLDARP